MYERSIAYLLSKQTYIQHASTIIFIVGFLFDMVVLPDIDDPITKYVGITYLFAIALLIMFREWVVSRNTASRTEQRIYAASSFGIAYFSGSALSFVVVYALRSAALTVSWPLFVIFFLCMIANEFVSSYNFRFTLDVAIFFIALLFYIVFNIPVLVKTQTSFIFILSILVTITISVLYVYFLSKISDTSYNEAPRGYALAVGIPMFVGMLYFLQVLPAVPLALKNQGVYYSVIKTETGEYLGEKEVDTRIFSTLRKPVIHVTNSQGVYFFSAVDAPSQLSAPMSHVWEYHDDKKGWVQESVISFDLMGGRNDGYRAYSKKENVRPGLWRVTVKVDGTRIIGRTTFYVTISEKNIPITIEKVSL